MALRCLLRLLHLFLHIHRNSAMHHRCETCTLCLLVAVKLELMPSSGGRKIYERLYIGVATHINIQVLCKERRLAASC